MDSHFCGFWSMWGVGSVAQVWPLAAFLSVAAHWGHPASRPALDLVTELFSPEHFADLLFRVGEMLAQEK